MLLFHIYRATENHLRKPFFKFAIAENEFGGETGMEMPTQSNVTRCRANEKRINVVAVAAKTEITRPRPLCKH